MRFFNEPAWTQMWNDPDVDNFAVGNPHEMPLEGITDALQRWSQPQNKDWFAYKLSEPESRATVAETLRELRGIPFEAEDIAMTNGGFAAIQLSLQTLVNPGDEVIFITPPWFFYELLIVHAGGVPVRVKINPESFDLDLGAIEAAISDRTRVILVNSPNNPTGKVYPHETLQALAQILTTASERNGSPIYLLSDEAYNRIIYDGKHFESPVTHYPNSLLLYTYGKTLLMPGQRLGYIALPPTMSDREMIRNAIMVSQLASGFSFPNALLQHALGDLEKLSIDIEHLQYKRDWLVSELSNIGYDVHTPEGTFYLLPKSPIDDDWEFAHVLSRHKILCLPGTIVEMPGYFRLSLTANDTMIERSIARFKSALEEARGK
jgi:aspartate aminotransferase